jgi:hypothetical protein
VDGKLWMMGSNWSGELGTGMGKKLSNRDLYEVPNLENVIDVGK